MSKAMGDASRELSSLRDAHHRQTDRIAEVEAVSAALVEEHSASVHHVQQSHKKAIQDLLHSQQLELAAREDEMSKNFLSQLQQQQESLAGEAGREKENLRKQLFALSGELDTLQRSLASKDAEMLSLKADLEKQLQASKAQTEERLSVKAVTSEYEELLKSQAASLVNVWQRVLDDKLQALEDAHRSEMAEREADREAECSRF